MAASALIADQNGSAQNSENPPRIVRLWSEASRSEQKIRFAALQIQVDIDKGMKVWELAYEAWRNLPKQVRIDLPSPRMFAAVLGLFLTGATLKTKKMLLLELSAADIAELLKCSKSTAEATLRWLGSGPIIHHGEQITRGLGLIHRGRRTALGYLQGVLRKVYRTSRTMLTAMGRMMLGLGALEEYRKEQKRQAYRQRKVDQAASGQAEIEKRELTHIQGHGDDGGGHDTKSDLVPTEVGRSWLTKIKERL
ncbi:MAG: hypothetical protein A2289_07170 [Deltaproteobacteria bacterium RIFOXYA12_FULL_58_15]|nr:MAG: hypothetical protein A2289_07170 [Deltaproteobacteria bacterium RIFOXYA12_FULL_58_15]OGR10469.1 MAG: hypothetical protein A2341_22310 [Deltaproteobacteria bacterium RIFOXYB12_FULL_58_9]